jgi:hypothetical protein
MLRRLINILLILAIGGSAVFGMPMHSGSSESGMMARCKAALQQDKSPQVAAARLCCAMNCDESGPTNGSSAQNFFQNSVQPAATVTLVLPTAATYKSAPVSHAQTARSSPRYILNLALLI